MEARSGWRSGATQQRDEVAGGFQLSVPHRHGQDGGDCGEAKEERECQRVASSSRAPSRRPRSRDRCRRRGANEHDH